jgi:serine/threonine protein kinase
MNEETLFEIALETPPAELQALLDRECDGNSALRERVEKLLAAHLASPDSLVSPAEKEVLGEKALGDSFPISPDVAIGTVLGGKYKLVQSIGEGGMGSVYMAQQTEPVQRMVAVKVIKAGMDSRAVLARFEAERQALAIMDHPNIAKVLDAGATQSGSPYFVMELVKGVPITKYCDEAKLTPKQRLELFLLVCEAVQHSHQKGIIHRDIKPSNVLVAMYDDRAVPKVIDFGVAKATGQSLADLDMITGFGALVGTPEYMSPEQANLNNLDIDTRSDVYSLGVLLYELLSGHTPVDRKSLEKAAILEILRIVRDVDAPLLSAKLSSIDTLPNVAANRRTEPKKLATQFRGELDWVLLKALEKDRSRRYSTASDLARDIQRYISDEIVEARPPSAFYTLQKLVKRNKGQVLAASLVLLALLAGIAGTTWGLFRAEKRRLEAETAQTEEAKQRGIAELNEAKAIVAKDEEAKQRAIAEDERKRAIEFRDKALDALRATTGEDVRKLIGEKTQLTDNEKAYLEAIAKRWQSFASQDGSDQQSRAIRGEGHYRVAFLWIKLGRLEEALVECDKALAVREKLSADFPDIPAFRQDLADSHNIYGKVFTDVGRLAEASSQFRKGMAIQESLVTDFPDEPTYREGLGLILNNLGSLYVEQGKTVESKEMFQKGLVIKEKLVADFPDRQQYREQLATHHNNFSLLLEEQGKIVEAMEESVRGLAIRKSLVADFPTELEYQQDLASSYNTYGSVLSELGRIDEAILQIREGLGIRQNLASAYPAIAKYSKDLSSSYNSLGRVLKKLGKDAEAEESYRSLIAIQETLIENFPTVPEYRQDLAVGHNNLGALLKSSGRYADAHVQYRKAIGIREKLVTDFTAVPEYRQQLGAAYSNLANLLLNEKKYKDAEVLYRQALAIQGKLVVEFPDLPSCRQNLAHFYFKLAGLLKKTGKVEEAKDNCYRGIALLEKLVLDLPGTQDHELSLGRVYELLATIKLETEQPGESIVWFDKAIETLGLLVQTNPEDKLSRGILSRCHEERAQAYDGYQKYTEAAADWLKALELGSKANSRNLKASRARSLANSGMTSDGIELIADLIDSSHEKGDLWFQCACVFSIASGKEEERKQEYADRAMQLLGKAVQFGYNNRKQLKSDRDLDPIRDRDDFAKLLNELETKGTKSDSSSESQD